MITLGGSFNSAVIMAREVEATALAQIKALINHRAFEGKKIVIMPDCHAGAGAVIGFTMEMNNFVIPNVIGVDIGCGIEAYKLGRVDTDFAALDTFIRGNIPSGFEVRHRPEITDADNYYTQNLEKSIERISRVMALDFKRVQCSIGTLGGGNHFIELDLDEDENTWLVIHTGSRNFGLKIAEHHQKIARQLDKNRKSSSPSGLEYLETDSDEGIRYIEDMKTAQQYAQVNRRTIAEKIIEGFFGLKTEACDSVKSVHNYINFEDRIIRKGAISAHKNERIVIPFNMRDGLVLARGKGSSEWNNSAPHGAGRKMSRTEAKSTLSLQSYKETMKGIWSSCLSKGTLDEAPDAYKNPDEIISAIGETASIEAVLKPLYNFKASE